MRYGGLPGTVTLVTKTQKKYLFSDTTPPPFTVVRAGRRYEVRWWRTGNVIISGLLKADAEEVASFLNEKLKKSLDRPRQVVA